jgi:ribosomal protein S18 acetylase RimI-like enzyme
MKKPRPSQKARVVEILTESFDENKSVNYVVKQDSNRKSRLRGLMDYCYNVCEAFGEVWISEDEQACALILHPDKKRTKLRAILWDVKLAFSVIGLSRVGQVMARESKIKKFHPKEPFSYLWFIGVDPSLQNNGKGSRLLEEIIQHSEQQGRPIYLETSVDRNLPWYKKFGFGIFQSFDLTYTLYMMRRVKGATDLVSDSKMEMKQGIRG